MIFLVILFFIWLITGIIFILGCTSDTLWICSLYERLYNEYKLTKTGALIPTILCGIIYLPFIIIEVFSALLAMLYHFIWKKYQKIFKRKDGYDK